MKSRPLGRSENDEEQPRLAVLIDADNAQPAVIEGLLAETAKYGVASVKRIYGDFTSTRMTQWKQALLKHSINPVQQFAYTSGKNATDSSLIIDAMDLMYTRRFDGVCLVSSDSDSRKRSICSTASTGGDCMTASPASRRRTTSTELRATSSTARQAASTATLPPALARVGSRWLNADSLPAPEIRTMNRENGSTQG